MIVIEQSTKFNLLARNGDSSKCSIMEFLVNILNEMLGRLHAFCEGDPKSLKKRFLISLVKAKCFVIPISILISVSIYLLEGHFQNYGGTPCRPDPCNLYCRDVKMDYSEQNILIRACFIRTEVWTLKLASSSPKCYRQVFVLYNISNN